MYYQEQHHLFRLHGKLHQSGIHAGEQIYIYIYAFLISNFLHVLYVVCFLLGNSPASEFYMPTFRNTLFHLHRRIGIPIRLWRWNRQSLPKRRHIKFRSRGITQKKAYNKYMPTHLNKSQSVYPASALCIVLNITLHKGHIICEANRFIIAQNGSNCSETAVERMVLH